MLMMQSTGCMALHPVQERCCRWLLMAHDRVAQDEFHLSHEFLAMMLGSTRPTVTIVAGTLQKAGLITYTHGRIKITETPLMAGQAVWYSTRPFPSHHQIVHPELNQRINANAAIPSQRR